MVIKPVPKSNKSMFGNQPSKEADYEEMDPHIRYLVKILNDCGYDTCTSCDGGRGHSFSKPTVGIMLQKVNRKQYEKIRNHIAQIIKPYFERFGIARYTSYAKFGVAWEQIVITTNGKFLRKFSKAQKTKTLKKDI